MQMENLKMRDVTNVDTYLTVVPVDIAAVPVRELTDPQPRSEGGKPMHVRSVPQMRAYAEHILKDPRVTEFSMVADPGLGKSTVFPLMLARSAKTLVVVVEFCGGLAECVSEGLTRARDASREFGKIAVTWCGDEFRTKDLMVLKAPHVVVISARRLMVALAEGRPMPDAVVVHDESHYSDYVTYSWRKLAAEFSWVKTNVAMSATLSPDVKSENSAIDGVRQERREVEMVVPPVSEWVKRGVPESAPVPWSVSSLRRKKTLIFSEDVEANERYAESLQEAGCRVFHLHAGSRAAKVREFRLAAARSSNTVVIFADAAYRHGFNFELDTVIDCGYVREEFITGERVWMRYRLANQVEILQGAARVARRKAGVVFRNKAEYPSHVPVLALGEVRHAAALHLLLGFNPPQVLCELVPEVAEWTVATAQGVVRNTLQELIRGPGRIAKVTVVQTSDARVGAKETLSSVKPERVRSAEGIADIVNRARCMTLAPRHEDEVFSPNHPGVRFDVPSTFGVVADPYWVKPKDAERMMRRMLSGQGQFDVEMLKTAEVQWFALHLTNAWNAAADAVIDRSFALAAVQDVVDSGASMHGHIWETLQDEHRTMTMQIRAMESVLELMKGLYRCKPFAVRVRVISDADSIRRRTEMARLDASSTSVSHARLLAQSSAMSRPYSLLRDKPEGTSSFAWYPAAVNSRSAVRIADGTVSSESDYNGHK